MSPRTDEFTNRMHSYSESFIHTINQLGLELEMDPDGQELLDRIHVNQMGHGLFIALWKGSPSLPSHHPLTVVSTGKSRETALQQLLASTAFVIEQSALRAEGPSFSELFQARV